MKIALALCLVLFAVLALAEPEVKKAEEDKVAPVEQEAEESDTSSDTSVSSDPSSFVRGNKCCRWSTSCQNQICNLKRQCKKCYGSGRYRRCYAGKCGKCVRRCFRRLYCSRGCRRRYCRCLQKVGCKCLRQRCYYAYGCNCGFHNCICVLRHSNGHCRSRQCIYRRGCSCRRRVCFCVRRVRLTTGKYRCAQRKCAMKTGCSCVRKSCRCTKYKTIRNIRRCIGRRCSKYSGCRIYRNDRWQCGR